MTCPNFGFRHFLFTTKYIYNKYTNCQTLNTKHYFTKNKLNPTGITQYDTSLKIRNQNVRAVDKLRGFFCHFTRKQLLWLLVCFSAHKCRVWSTPKISLEENSFLLQQISIFQGKTNDRVCSPENVFIYLKPVYSCSMFSLINFHVLSTEAQLWKARQDVWMVTNWSISSWAMSYCNLYSFVWNDSDHL